MILNYKKEPKQTINFDHYLATYNKDNLNKVDNEGNIQERILKEENDLNMENDLKEKLIPKKYIEL